MSNSPSPVRNVPRLSGPQFSATIRRGDKSGVYVLELNDDEMERFKVSEKRITFEFLADMDGGYGPYTRLISPDSGGKIDEVDKLLEMMRCGSGEAADEAAQCLETYYNYLLWQRGDTIIVPEID